MRTHLFIQKATPFLGGEGDLESQSSRLFLHHRGKGSAEVSEEERDNDAGRNGGA